MPTLTDAIAHAFQSFETKAFDRAEWWCRQVLQKEPHRAEMLNLLGAVCYQTGRLMDAIGWYREAIDAQPNYPEAYNNLGVALLDLGQLDVAMAQFEAAIELAPNYTQAYFNLGNALQEDGPHEVAIAAYQRALTLDPKHVPARNNLAYLYQTIGNYQQAIALYRQALGLNPDSALAHMNLANLLQEQGNFDGAMVHYEKAILLDPSNADRFYNLAVAYQSMGQTDRAIPTYYEALRLNSRHAASHYNLGMLLRADRPTEALAHLQQAITYQPDVAEPYNSIGLVWQDRQEIAAAIASFRQALELDPDLAEAHVNLGKALLLAGNYPDGFAEYEWRWQSAAFLQTQLPRHKSIPRWEAGIDVAGKTVLLWAEQGLRETLLFVRFVPIVKALGATVIVECDRQLVALFEQIPGIGAVIAKGDPFASCDLQAPFLSLPMILGTTIDTIPHSPQRQSAKPIASTGQRISLAVSEPISEMLRSQFTTVSTVELVKLPEIDSATNITTLATTIADCDLIITLDSPIAHLAGYLGIPTWVMLEFSSDWVWLCDRADSPWYETVKLFRQSESKDWESVVQAIVTEFKHSPTSENHPLAHQP
jgi:tetratricopeptide (TPR) repeat protein